MSVIGAFGSTFGFSLGPAEQFCAETAQARDRRMTTAIPSTSEQLHGRWWLVVVVVLVSIGIAALLTTQQVPVYGAQATWAVVPNSEVQDTGDILRSIETLERRTLLATFARLPGTRTARAELEERLGLDPGGLTGYQLRGTVVPYTNLIRFEVEGPDHQMVAEAANELARRIRTSARPLYRLYSLREVEQARASRRPLSPDWRRNLVVGALIGMFLGTGLLVGSSFAASTGRPSNPTSRFRTS